MLVLTRKTNQQIQIGPDVQVMVVEIRGEQVRLGVEAPATVAVHRAEIAAKIRAREAGTRTHADGRDHRLTGRSIAIRHLRTIERLLMLSTAVTLAGGGGAVEAALAFARSLRAQLEARDVAQVAAASIQQPEDAA